MKNSIARFAIALVFLAAPLLAQMAPSIPSADALVKLKLEISSNPPSGGEVRGVVTADVLEGWHINSNTPKSEFLIPSVITVSSPALQNVVVSYPAHVERTFGFSADKLAVYEGAVKFPFTATRTAATGDGVEIKLSYQACNDQVCLPPKESALKSSLTGKGAADVSFTPLAAAPSGPGKKASVFSGDIGGIFASHGLLVAILVTFILGVALNLTPCVYPLIPITLAYFASQSEGNRSRRNVLSFGYVGGLVITYAGLGVFAALSGALFGAWLQHPGVLIFFAALMVVLALSMFGLYEFKVPHFISDRAGARAGFAGALGMGMLSGIVAAPCVGPVLVSLIAFVGQTKSIPLGILLFVVLALGLGLPYLIGLTALPRSGAWMVQIKKALGFVLLAMLFYFLRPLTGEFVFSIGFGSMLLIGALFLILKKEPGTSANVIRFVFIGLFVAGAVYFLIPQKKGPGIEWVSYSDAALTGARIAGRPAVIDFYADWCIPCKELDSKTFSDPLVVSESERFVRLKADLTSGDDDATKLLAARYKIVGVPTIVFVSADGKELEELRLTGFENSTSFVERMRKAR